jgi:hypothetical protein
MAAKAPITSQESSEPQIHQSSPAAANGGSARQSHRREHDSIPASAPAISLQPVRASQNIKGTIQRRKHSFGPAAGDIYRWCHDKITAIQNNITSFYYETELIVRKSANLVHGYGMNFFRKLRKLTEAFSTQGKKQLVKLSNHIWLLKWHLLCTIIFTLVVSFSITANSVIGPLTTLTPSMGTLLLNLFSKGTDFALGLAVGASWEVIQWGPMMKESGERLLTYFLMTCGFKGWWETLFHTTPNTRIFSKEGMFASRCQPSWPALLSFLQLVLYVKFSKTWRVLTQYSISIWLLLQFPGIILMGMLRLKIALGEAKLIYLSHC